MRTIWIKLSKRLESEVERLDTKGSGAIRPYLQKPQLVGGHQQTAEGKRGPTLKGTFDAWWVKKVTRKGSRGQNTGSIQVGVASKADTLQKGGV